MGILIDEFCFNFQRSLALEIQYNTLSDLMAEINIKLSPEDYKDPVLQSIKKQGKNAQLPGFRPGKIPVSMLKKMVGKPVMIEEINRLLQESLNEYVEKESLDLLGSPLPTDSKTEDYFDLGLDKELDFSFEIGLSPNFELKLEDLPAVEEYEIEIDDKYLEQELDRSRERYSEVENPESVEKGDIIFGQIAERDADGNEIEEGFNKMIVLNPTRIDNPEKLEIFEGKEIGFITPFSTDWYAEEAEKVAELMFMSPEEVEELKGKELQFELKRINRTTPAELNDEFYRKVLGPMYPQPEVEEANVEEPDDEATEEEKTDTPETENVENQEEAPQKSEIDEATFRNKFAELLKTDWERELVGELNSRIREKVLEIHSLELPEAYLKNLYKAEQKEEPTEEQIETAYPNYERSMKWTLIVDKMFKEDESIKVTEEEINQGIAEMYLSYYPNIGMEELQAVVENSKQNPDILQQVSVRKMEEKIFTFLRDKWPLTPTSITVSDFLEKNKPEEQK